MPTAFEVPGINPEDAQPQANRIFDGDMQNNVHCYGSSKCSNANKDHADAPVLDACFAWRGNEKIIFKPVQIEQLQNSSAGGPSNE